MYCDIPLVRQRLIIKIANRKRRFLDVWQKQQLAIWQRAIKKGEALPEQQRFFMRGIEEHLIFKGWIGPEQETLL